MNIYRLCQAELIWYYIYRGLRPTWTGGIACSDIEGCAWRQLVLEQIEMESHWHGRYASDSNLQEINSGQLKSIEYPYVYDSDETDEVSGKWERCAISYTAVLLTTIMLTHFTIDIMTREWQ